MVKVDYNKLSEEDTKRIEITPSIIERGWDNKTQIKQEVSFTKGRIMIRGKEVKRGEPKRADYVLFFYKITGFIGGKGIGIQRLSSGVLHNILIPLLPLTEQKRIVAKVDELMHYCNKL